MRRFILCTALLLPIAGRAVMAQGTSPAVADTVASPGKKPNQPRLLRIPVDSGEVRIEVSRAAAAVEVISPAGTFVDVFSRDEALLNWADAAEGLPAPRQGDEGDKLRYSAVRLADPEPAIPGVTHHTSLFLLRLDTAFVTRYLLTCTNGVWTCAVTLSPDQAAALFAALRGEPSAGALPYEHPSIGSANEPERPHVSGAWLQNQVDHVAARRSATLFGLHYPPELTGTGKKGTVTFEFIIDSTGRVPPWSVRLIGNEHPAFVRAARTTLLEMRYRPADRKGKPVAMMANQQFIFRETDPQENR